jgi:hypothetical protein
LIFFGKGKNKGKGEGRGLLNRAINENARNTHILFG